VGGGRDAWVVRRGGTQSTLRARGPCLPWSAGRSTSPLDVVQSRLSFALLISALAIVGCASVDIQFTPNVSGYLYEGNVPVVGADVYVQAAFHSVCGYSTLQDTTSSQGRFSIPAAYKRKWGSIGDWGDLPWGVCIRYKHEWILGYAEEHFSPHSRIVHLRCDLATHPAADSSGGRTETLAVCRRDDV